MNRIKCNTTEFFFYIYDMQLKGLHGRQEVIKKIIDFKNKI